MLYPNWKLIFSTNTSFKVEFPPDLLPTVPLLNVITIKRLTVNQVPYPLPNTHIHTHTESHMYTN
jgi:hypothetical protein